MLLGKELQSQLTVRCLALSQGVHFLVQWARTCHGRKLLRLEYLEQFKCWSRFEITGVCAWLPS
jgi:hypothetical protein